MRIGEIGAGPAVGIPKRTYPGYPIPQVLAHIRDRAGPSQWRLKSDSKTAWRSGETTRTIESDLTIHDERNVIGTAITTTTIEYGSRDLYKQEYRARHSSERRREGSAISGGN